MILSERCHGSSKGHDNSNIIQGTSREIQMSYFTPENIRKNLHIQHIHASIRMYQYIHIEYGSDGKMVVPLTFKRRKTKEIKKTNNKYVEFSTKNSNWATLLKTPVILNIKMHLCLPVNYCHYIICAI